MTDNPSPDSGASDAQRSMESRSPATPETPREVDSRDLMRGDREIVIRHGTDAYRLSVTRSGKLILRK